MRAPSAIRIAPLLIVFAPCVAAASHVIVPDQYASVQAAMDSGTDSVLVKDGKYNENLVMNQSVSILAYAPPLQFGPAFAAPVVNGFAVNPLAPFLSAAVQGLRFRGPASLTFLNGSISFESCRFDSGAVSTGVPGNNFLYFRGCTFLCRCAITADSWEVVNSVLIGTGLVGFYDGYAFIRNNVVQGPAAAGISSNGQQGGVEITGNSVSGTIDGILVTNPSGTYVADNDIRNCTGTAVRTTGGGSSGLTLVNNRVTSCGGRGFDLESAATLTCNTVDSVGSDGVRIGQSMFAILRNNTITHVGGNGVFGDTYSDVSASLNRVIGAVQHGFALAYAGTVDSNVVGRALGHGIYVSGAGVSGHVLRSNTVFECGGAGFAIAVPVDSLDHNVAYGNAGYGLVLTVGHAPALGCNDWNANVSGSTSGIAPGATDLSVDPQFCNLPADDVHISSTSPLASASGCGLIGALGVGCSSPLSASDPAASEKLALSVMPSPARGHVTFAARGAQGPASIEVFDLSGARRWHSAWQQGQSSMEWNGTDSAGLKIAPGVYYARLASGTETRTARVVLIR